jgi:HAD superfamily hydrolase (TIGR01549 family)
MQGDTAHVAAVGAPQPAETRALKAVLLDLFGTVVAYGDVREGSRRAWRAIHAALQSLGAQVSFEAFVPDWQSQLFEPLAPQDDIAETPFLGKILRLFRRYGVAEDLAVARRAADECLAAWDTHLFVPDDTHSTLQALRQRFALALVSNFDHPCYVRDLLQRHALLDLFDAIVISGDIRIEKPDPRIFHQALQALQVAPAEGVFVGDSLDTDIAGARAVGCRAVLIDMQGHHADYQGERIASLGELPQFLDGREE